MIYTECSMSTQSQYGHTLFLDGFQEGSSAKKLEPVHFSKKASESALYDEAWLQHLIMHHPSLLPVDQIEPAFTPLVPICVELRMPSGFLDNLLVTPSGALALVECKLWRNPQARREVVAQIIDYAKDMSTWTYDTLQTAIEDAINREEAINRTRPLDASEDKRTRRLYELVSKKGGIDEVSFHDAVSRNLKRGRFLLLIVGDGIREGVEAMAEFLQQHAGFHFTLAFVELALFKAPNTGYIAQPRVLAKTTMIPRGIVTLDEGRIAIGPPIMRPAAIDTPRRTTLTKELYFEQLEKHLPGISERLNAFLDNLATYNVSPEFGTDCLMLKWRPDDGKSWNLGTVSSHGQVYTDTLYAQANNEALLERGQQYIEKLADLVPGALVKKGKAWGVAQNDKTITLDALLADESRRDGWVRAIAEFRDAVMKVSDDD